MDNNKESGSETRDEEIACSYCQWAENEWKTLLDAISRGDCILMLGPDAAVVEDNEKTRPLTEILANKLAEKISPETKAHIDTYCLAQVAQYYLKDYGEKDLRSQVSMFYREWNGLTSSLHTNQAALPFYFTITTTLDNMFLEALHKKNKNPQVGWYNFRKSPQFDVDINMSGNPLIFYLYGNLEEEKSLLLAESDLLHFLVALINENTGLQDNIQSELQDEDKIFLFFGFGFKHWYLRILIHVLRGCKNYSRSFALEQYEPENISKLQLQETVFFFKKNDYRIHIFKEDFQQFAKELRKRFKDFPHKCIPNVEKEKSPEVFICHAHENEENAVKLFKRFEEKGLSPWLDKKNIEPGEEWEKCIEKTIKRVDYFVVLVSEALNNRMQDYVGKEIDLALDIQNKSKTKRRFIIPAAIEKSIVVEKLKTIHAIYLNDDADINQLVNTIQRDFIKRNKL